MAGPGESRVRCKEILWAQLQDRSSHHSCKGVEDSVIKTLGRWQSLAYLEYIRIPREQLANYSHMLDS